MMADEKYRSLGINTQATRAGQKRSFEGEHSELIFASSSYIFKNAAEAAARFAGDSDGNIYSRFTNPTVRVFEERLAAMGKGRTLHCNVIGYGCYIDYGTWSIEVR